LKLTWQGVLHSALDAVKLNIWCRVRCRHTAAAKGLAASVTGTVSTAAAATFTWKEMNSLKHAIDPAYRGGPKFRWAFNDGTLQVIEEMVDDQKRPLWLMLLVVPRRPFWYSICDRSGN
jgi:hypothetical protein